jgi:uncharacterized membrane protein YfcA
VTASLIFGGIAALLVGFSKTGVPGPGILIIPFMNIVFPDAKLTTGAMLPMLIMGDIFAVYRYRKSTRWDHLLKLLPFVAAGMIPGFILLAVIDGRTLKPLLGIIILVLVLLELLRLKFKWENIPHAWWFGGGLGFLAGFGTAVGHAAGPVMGIYLLSRGFPKQEFMGTRAWFFFIVNVSKIPIYPFLGMMNAATLRFDLYAAPVILIGIIAGFRVFRYIPQKAFNGVVLVLAFLVAMKMIFI